MLARPFIIYNSTFIIAKSVFALASFLLLLQGLGEKTGKAPEKYFEKRGKTLKDI